MNLLIGIFISLNSVLSLNWDPQYQTQSQRDYLIITSNVEIKQAEESKTSNIINSSKQQNNQDFNLNDEIKQRLMKEFNSYDNNNDGKLTVSELKESFKGEAEEQIRILFGFGDINMDGTLNYEEFLKYRIYQHQDL